MLLIVVIKCSDIKKGGVITMPIMLKRKDGSVTPFVNAEYLAAFYLIPLDLLQKMEKQVRNLPRNPRRLCHDWNAIEVVESDYFLNCIIDAWRYMIWPFLQLKAPREIFSGDEPAWRFCAALPLWVDEFEERGIIPTQADLFADGGADVEFGYVPLDVISLIFSAVIPEIAEKHKIREIFEIAREHRCFEDFDWRTSFQKSDFYRKWYHTRTAHPMISLEKYKADCKRKKIEWEPPTNAPGPESTVVSQMYVEQFLDSLPPKDREMLELRMDGKTLEEIAKELGYANHSGVLKRLRKIGEAYREYAAKE